MPNWVANRIYFDPAKGATRESVIQAMDSSGFSELLAHGVHSARALFLLVFSGVIRVRGECYGHEPFSWMTKYGGARVDFNKPIDDEASDLALELTGVFDTDKLTRLVAFANSRRFFDTIDTLVECVTASESWKQSADLFKEVYFDYCADMFTRTDQTNTINDRYFGWLNYYYRKDEEIPVRVKEPTDPDGYHSMLEVIPPDVLPEINGFNGHMRAPDPDNPLRLGRLGSRHSSYGSYVSKYGTKWPGFQFHVNVDEDTKMVYLDFDTAWSPPNEDYYDLLSERHPSMTEIYYAEAGMAFCGSGLVLHPGTTFWRSADLNFEYKDPDNDDYEVVSISPEWIVDKVGHYGG